jgi:glucan biosynthesis protein
MKRAALLIVSLCSISSIDATAATRAGRPMIIHRLSEMNLEIWTEHDPEWETSVNRSTHALTFTAETPALTYPPTHMSWTISKKLKFEPEELKDAARGVMYQMALRYDTLPPKQITQAQYGELEGYEAILQAEPQNIPIEVRVFCGHREGKPMVVMQAVTLKGKLTHVAEHVRRSWTHLRYLD